VLTVRSRSMIKWRSLHYHYTSTVNTIKKHSSHFSRRKGWNAVSQVPLFFCQFLSWLIFRPWRWRRQIHLKCWVLSKMQSVATEMSVIITFTTMKTWIITICYFQNGDTDVDPNARVIEEE
jgi:hypothetical protein